MTDSAVPSRADIPQKYTWNAQSVFRSHAAWESEFAGLANRLADFGGFQGQLSESPARLAEAFEALYRAHRGFVLFRPPLIPVDSGQWAGQWPPRPNGANGFSPPQRHWRAA